MDSVNGTAPRNQRDDVSASSADFGLGAAKLEVFGAVIQLKVEGRKSKVVKKVVKKAAPKKSVKKKVAKKTIKISRKKSKVSKRR